MKRLVAVAAVALMAVAVYAVTASGTPQAVTPKQFAALSKRVKNLERDLSGLEGCINFISVNRFGDEQNQTEGYVYVDNQNNQFVTTALDLTDAAHAGAWVFVAANNSCVSSSKVKALASRSRTR